MSKWVEKGREKRKERRKHVAMQTASLMSPESMDQITPSAHAPYSNGASFLYRLPLKRPLNSEIFVRTSQDLGCY